MTVWHVGGLLILATLGRLLLAVILGLLLGGLIVAMLQLARAAGRW